MSRIRSADSESSVELFPFLSILACIIGALTLIISALSLSQIFHGRGEEAVARAEEFLSLEAREKALRQNLEALRARIARENRELQEKLKLEAELAQLSRQTEAKTLAASESGELEKRAVVLRKTASEAEAGRAETRESIREIEAKLAAASGTPEGIPMKILPSGGGFRPVTPIFAETTAKSVVLYSPSRTVTVPAERIASDPDFAKFADFAAADERRLLIFLIRRGSHSTWRLAHSAATARKAPVAKVPLPGEGPVDLRAFFERGKRR